MEGPKPKWARTDGGEGGSHPSNVHDHVYAIGSINFTGDMPIALMPDGPSLGGFVCPATIISAEMWKMGQVRQPRSACSNRQRTNVNACDRFLRSLPRIIPDLIDIQIASTHLKPSLSVMRAGISRRPGAVRPADAAGGIP